MSPKQEAVTRSYPSSRPAAFARSGKPGFRPSAPGGTRKGLLRRKRRRRALLALACMLAIGVPLTTGAVHAAQGQTQATGGAEKAGIAATWQGAAHWPDGHDLRIVLRIAKDEKGGLKATLYSIDQNRPPIVFDSVHFDGATLKLVNDFPGFTYAGKLSADKNSITGILTQDGSFPLVLERATPETEWATPAPMPRNAPMAPDAKPGVEVATVKPAQPGSNFFMLTMQGGNLEVKNFTLHNLVKFAYDVPDRQIAGGPSWMDTDRWDIEAKPDTPGMPSIAQMRAIMQSVLVERFALKAHEEKREMAAYAVIVGKDGPKLTKTADASLSPNFAMGPLGVLRVRSATIGDLAHLLQGDILGQPVVDNTGLDGKWDFTLKWTPDETQFANAPVKVPPPADDDANAPPPLFTAIQEQLGLKLESQKADVPVLMIDHVDHPSPN